MDKNKLAAFMIKHGFATGHGDSFDDLLTEFDWQLIERTKNANRYIWMQTHISDDLEWYLLGNSGHGSVGMSEAIDANILSPLDVVR